MRSSMPVNCLLVKMKSLGFICRCHLNGVWRRVPYVLGSSIYKEFVLVPNTSIFN